MNIKQIENLVNQYGENVTLGMLLEHLKKQYPDMCPECQGQGTIRTKVRDACHGYWEAEYRTHKCEKCNGMGYLYRRLQPYMRLNADGYMELDWR